MVEEKISKGQGQRKRRYERDTCINNLKLNLNVSSTKADYIRWQSNKSRPQNRVCTNLKDKYSRGSLDNVSRIPWEECNLDEESSLRRTRSLAISRENLFYSLDYTEKTENHSRRAQLIPRAKLIEKSFAKESRCETFQVEHIRSSTKKSLNKPQEIPPDYSPLPRITNVNHFRVDDHIYDFPLAYSSRNNSSNNTRSRKSHEDFTGLSLPNYYPDSEVTDNISLTDIQSTFSQEKLRYTSLDNFPWGISEQPDSIPYDENIVLTKKPESVYTKPRTIRGPIPYHHFAYEKLPQFGSSEKGEDSEKRSESTTEQQSSLEFETNTNCDEIKLNNEHISKEKSDTKLLNYEELDHCGVDNTISKIKRNVAPSSTELLNTLEPEVTLKIEKPSIEASRTEEVKSDTENKTATQVKTLIEVCHIEKSKQSEEFKSIIDLKPDNEDEIKNHSHNYLKEFLETQKGSKKPLQTFIAKKFSNLTRRQAKSNLVINQFYSLPDISASKSLDKCEKIDRKLRKCDKLVKAPLSENRFIVNIGNHFDITAKSNIPVDFRVKIAKIPKKNKKHLPNNKSKEQEFAEAVKSINNTLLNNGFCIDFNNNKTQEGEFEVKASKSTEKKVFEEMMDPEIQEKVDNMRSYWTNMVGRNDSEKCDEEKVLDSPSCKIVEIHTKVHNVKMKFQTDREENEDTEISPNKVQLAKQLFEPKLIQQKADKISPIIKETCSYFEKPQMRGSSCYESLSPSSVELVTVTRKNYPGTDCQNKPPLESARSKRTLAKANSINVPEFDHVRYKVIKPELFNKKIIANCENQTQFDGLIQYLQDYSFQELLIDNNIVIIEPIRTKVPHQNTRSVSKSSKNNNSVNNVPNTGKDGELDDVKQGIRKHFFYHPIRVNKEVNDDELPNPEVVRQARQFFEKEVLKIQNHRENGLEKEQYKNDGVDPDKDKCSTSSSVASTISDAEEDPIYDSLDHEECCTTEYVSEDVMEKIREYGTTVTYYGGRVVNQHNGQPILTKVIMEEIKNNEKRCMECNSCRRRSMDKTLNEINNEYQGIKFKLIKSNSCNSRLELVGAAKNKDFSKNSINKINVNKRIEVNANDNSNDIKGINIFSDKNAINENIKLASQPKIIGREGKVPNSNKCAPWNEIKNDQTNTQIQLSEKDYVKIKNYDYQEKIKSNKRSCDMEFESYEVASK